MLIVYSRQEGHEGSKSFAATKSCISRHLQTQDFGRLLWQRRASYDVSDMVAGTSSSYDWPV